MTYLTSLSERSLAWAYKFFSFAKEVFPGFSTTSGAAIKMQRVIRKRKKKEKSAPHKLEWSTISLSNFEFRVGDNEKEMVVSCYCMATTIKAIAG